jgi:hypothetical protein
VGVLQHQREIRKLRPTAIQAATVEGLLSRVKRRCDCELEGAASREIDEAVDERVELIALTLFDALPGGYALRLDHRVEMWGASRYLQSACPGSRILSID